MPYGAANSMSHRNDESNSCQTTKCRRRGSDILPAIESRRGAARIAAVRVAAVAEPPQQQHRKGIASLRPSAGFFNKSPSATLSRI